MSAVICIVVSHVVGARIGFVLYTCVPVVDSVVFYQALIHTRCQTKKYYAPGILPDPIF